MRFIHIADLHLGRSVNSVSLIGDQAYILDSIVSEASARGADAVLISGDIFDRHVPSEEAVGLLDRFLTALTGRGIRVFMISGNHDSDERLAYGRGFFMRSGVHIAAKYDGFIERAELSDEFGSVSFYMLPFVKAGRVRHFHEDFDSRDYGEAVRYVINAANIDPSERNVILAHQFVAGYGGDVELSGSELSAMSAGSIERVGCDVFDIFDYAALGHIHRPQQVGRPAVRYAGSPLCYSVDEAGQEKSAVLVELGAKGDVNIELIPLVPKRQMLHIRGELSELLASAGPGSEDLIYATLTDSDMPPYAADRLRSVYPNLLKVDRTGRAAAEGVSAGPKSRETRSFAELAAAFKTKVTGEEFDPYELQLLMAAAGEAGLINETD